MAEAVKKKSAKSTGSTTRRRVSASKKTNTAAMTPKKVEVAQVQPTEMSGTGESALRKNTKGGKMQDKLVPVLTGALVVAAFVVGLLYGKLSVLQAGGGVNKPSGNVVADANQAAPTPAPVVIDEATWDKLLSKPASSMGDKNAKVVMVEFTDFQCPYCEAYFTQTYNQIKEEYVDTGKVYYVSRDLPLVTLHPNAHIAAEAARCAGDQGKYYEMHDKLFENQSGWSSLGDPKETFGEYAKEVGLNVTKFNNCLANGEMKDLVDDDLALSQQVGASGTPTFYINGKQLVGAQPYAAFKAELDQALAQN